MSQHLHNMIGNAIGECKRAMFDRLNAGADANEVMAQFFAELSVRFDAILQGMAGDRRRSW